MANELKTLEAIRKIISMVDDGWSIVYARKKVCGSDTGDLARAVLAHDLYLDVLNEYMQKHPGKQKFSRAENGKIIGVKSGIV